MQIIHKYSHNWDEQKYLDFGLEGYVQLVPSILLVPFRSLVELRLILWQFHLLQQVVFNSYPNISETAQEKVPKYFHLKSFWHEKMGAKVITLANPYTYMFIKG